MSERGGEFAQLRLLDWLDAVALAPSLRERVKVFAMTLPRWSAGTSGQNVRIDYADRELRFGQNRRTVERRVRELLEAGYLVQTRRAAPGRNALYALYGPAGFDPRSDGLATSDRITGNVSHERPTETPGLSDERPTEPPTTCRTSTSAATSDTNPAIVSDVEPATSDTFGGNVRQKPRDSVVHKQVSNSYAAVQLPNGATEGGETAGSVETDADGPPEGLRWARAALRRNRRPGTDSGTAAE